ncbi:AAA family ATPase [Deinococcus sp.]|uniref:AAA family ATPase n=1 Tax=Deinococcus sp. TaxID=47478 RepID=UPI003C79E795
MLTVHLLGHAHVTQNGQPVPLSAKAVALIAYLAAEKLPQHRERLADLLWNTAEARTNLRVELARIRSAGLNIFPASRQLLYLESISTDIDHWQAQQEHEMNQTELSTWLATLRGLPLCGLEDLGSTGFQVWVEEQRWMLCEKVESVLARVYAHYVRSGQDWAIRLISSRAEAVGFTDPAEFLTETLINEAVPLVRSGQAAPGASVGARAMQGGRAGRDLSGREGAQVPFSGGLGSQTFQTAGRDAGSLSGHRNGAPGKSQPGGSQVGGAQPGILQPGILQPGALQAGAFDLALHFARPNEEGQLQDLLSGGRPRLVLLHGPPGSGKTYLAERLAAQAAPTWEVLRLTAARSGRLLIAALAQSLLKFAEPDQGQILRQVLLQPGALEEDMVKVAVSLSNIGQPLLLLFDEVHAAPTELTGLLELICQMSSDQPRLLLLLGREAPDRQQVTRTLLRRLPFTQTLALPPVSLNSVQQVLMARYPHESSTRLQPLASRLTQRSEGNPLHLLSLMGTLPGAGNLGETDLGLLDLGSAALPQAVRDTLRSEPEGWPETLRDALSRLSVINGAFGRQVAQAALNLEGEAATDALLCDALERQILVEIDPGLALALPDLRPVRILPDADTEYLFRNEALRVTLAGQLPQLIRQDVRRRLTAALATDEPGLASYYAERAGLQDQAGQLWAQYQKRLPKDSPLLGQAEAVPSRPQGKPQSGRPGAVATLVDEPTRLTDVGQYAVSHQGYGVSLEDGWLHVMSDGRYGHPQTLTLRLNWPAPLTDDLRLVWRLDVFGGGEELGPSQAPFPLRLTPVRPEPLSVSSPRRGTAARDGSAFVFTPQRSGEYREGHLTCHLQPEVQLGQWMEHRLGGAAWQGAIGAEISVRALDVALTIGLIEPGFTAPGVVGPGSEGQSRLTVQVPTTGRKLKNSVANQTG